MGRSLHGARRVSRSPKPEPQGGNRRFAPWGVGLRLGRRPCYGSPVFGLGMMEIGLIVALAVMLFPPKELPKLARMVARVYGQVRKTADDFRSAVLEDEDLREPLDEIKGAYNEARFEVRDAERKARQQLAKAQMELRMATARRIQAEREAQAAAAARGAADEGPKSDDEPTSEDRASGAGPSPEGAGEPEPEDARGVVAGADPRIIAARRSGAYTPPSVAVDAPAPDSLDEEPREGVA
jgi:Sec-independent protein translocase protein TatA